MKLRNVSRKLSVLALGVAVLVGIGSAQATGPQPSRPSAQPGKSYVITLITGDKVRYSLIGNGKHVAVVEPADRGGLPTPSFSILEFDGNVQVVPSDVAALIPETLDPALFDVTRLVEDGLDDASTASLPLIVEYEAARTVLPAVLPDRKLESINASGARESKARAAELGRALAKGRDRQTAGPAPQAGSNGTGSGPLAGIKKIWLDATVHATLDVSVPQVGAPTAWAAGYDGSGVTVAVLDTGIDATHPDLVGKVTAVKNFTDSDTETDRYGHGTHVASTIAGTGAASAGLRTGVAPKALLISGKVLNDGGSGSTSSIIDGMEWATVEKGAKVVNMSLGGGATDGTDPLSQAVDTLSSEQGALFVVSAGNRGARGERTIGSPGAATSALTVGAVDKSDVLARFSSRGPRLGDLAIKPEITAPGVEIAAARASGTEMGSPVDDLYTSASGTSMAAPHVAGAAALMLQAHPGWGGDRIKGALVSTAKRNAKNTVFEQGNGRVDLARAFASKALASPGVLNLGFYKFPHDVRPPVTRVVTYTNISNEPLTLDLSLEARGQRGTGEPAPSGTLALSSDTLVLPPNGSAGVEVQLDTSKAAVDELYAGALTATQQGGDTALRTPLSFYLEPEKYDLTVSAITRDGRTANFRSGVIVMNVDDSRRFFASRGFPPGEPVTFRVPVGTYSVLGAIYTEDNPRYTTNETVIVGKPELEIRGDTALLLDARESSEVVIETPDHETKVRWNESLDFWSLYRKPLVGPSLVFSVLGAPGNVFAQATAPVAKGEFEASTRWHLEAPDVKARVSSPISLELHSVNPFPANKDNPRLEGEKVLPLVYANEGTIEDFADLDVRGKAVLMRKPNLDCPETGCVNQPNNAAAAGAAVAVVYNEYEPGDSYYFGFGQMDIPTLQLPGTEGQQLRDLLEEGSVTLELEGNSKSPYLYDVIFPEKAIPSSLHYVLRDADLAVVKNTFHNPGAPGRLEDLRFALRPFTNFASSFDRPIYGAPRTRTDYVSPGDTRWAQVVQHSGYTGREQMRTYTRGEKREQTWLKAPLRPSAVVRHGLPLELEYSTAARTADTLFLNIPAFVDGAGHWGVGQAASAFRLYQNGELIGSGEDAFGEFAIAPEPAEYRLELDVDASSDPMALLSTRTSTVWTLQSSSPGDGPQSPVPLLTVDYELGLDGFNRSTPPSGRKSANKIGLRVSHLQGAPAPAVRGLTLSMSYDDGTTWKPIQSLRALGNGAFEATLDERSPQSTNGFVALRVHAADVAGNAIDQTIIRAYAIGARNG